MHSWKYIMLNMLNILFHAFDATHNHLGKHNYISIA